jgi:hypothetical protein
VNIIAADQEPGGCCLTVIELRPLALNFAIEDEDEDEDEE